MGVIGLTAPWGNVYEIFGLDLPDFITVARDLVGELRNQGVSPIVVLSHLGLEDDRRLAAAVPGINLIIGSHSHDQLPQGEEKNGVLIAQAGQYGETLGRVNLSLDSNTGKALYRSAHVLEVPTNEPPDPLVLETIAAAEREIDDLVARPIGELQAALDLDHFRECGIGNLTADALRERLNAEAAIVWAGQLHQELPSGVVTLGQLDAACFSSANLGVTEVRGAQIIAALERGLDPGITEQLFRGSRGTPVGIPQISGMVVEYDPEREVGQRVRSVLVQGQPLDPNRIYRLAHTDAERIQEFGYLVLEEEQRTEYEVPTILREVMEAYIQRHSPVPMPKPGRWVRVEKKP